MNADDELVLDALPSASLGSDGVWFRVNCPFCIGTHGKDDKRWSLGIQRGSGAYHCFRCGTSGRLPAGALPDELAGFVLAERKRDEPPPMIQPPSGWTPLWFDPGLHAPTFTGARKYLHARGFDLDAWTSARIGAVDRGVHKYTTREGEEREQRVVRRVVVPVIASDGQTWLGWVARDWTGRAMRKYLYPGGMARGSILFEQARLTEPDDGQPVLVVEGVFDALPYLGHVVACLGKPSHRHVELLKETRRPLAVCLDGDAWEEGYALAMRLRLAGARAGFVRLPATEDPCSVDHDWLRKAAADSIKAL